MNIKIMPSHILGVMALATAVLAAPRSLNVATRSPGFVSKPLTRMTGNSQLSRRSATGIIDIGSLSALGLTAPYVAIELTVGNPPQNISVQLDSGSSVFWVSPTCTAWTGANLELCQKSHFNPNASTTAKNSAVTSTLTYGLGTANITWYTDDVTILGCDVKFPNAPVAVAQSTEELYMGIMGVGFNFGEEQHPNVIELLEKQGLTNTKAFGLGMGSIHKNEGSVIFGGLDTKKYSGNLTTLPLMVIPGLDAMVEQNHYAVTMTSLSISAQGHSTALSSENMTVVLDSGTSLGILPEPVFLHLAEALNGTFAEVPNYLFVDCALRQANATFDFAFPGVTIRVPFQNFILPPANGNATQCLVGTGTTAGTTVTSNIIILGDTFLQDAYVVFDQTNMQASLAQYVNCGSHEQAIPAGPNPMRQFKGEC